ncbi:lipopolysaccharide biosynthesis protein [Methylotuvimicrobium sp.]|uniref:lipopolysaccharide biosynthesis protein n=1 Tax=Methylotuvimicrobium sp. TaxID=2822413 RepID=UPI003D660B31
MTEETKQNSLKNKSIKAVMWSGGEVIARQGIRLIVSVFLARLLTPEEFGTVALIYIFSDIAHAFVDSGFSAALGQRQDITHTDESTVYWFSIGMAVICASLLWAASPYIADFYRLEVLAPLITVLGLNIVVMSLGSVHHPLLTKRLELKKITIITACALFISGCTAVWLAIEGFGVWALALQQVTESVVSSVLLWVLSGWRPGFVFSLASLKRLFGFGGFLMLTSFLDIAYNRAYALIVGKVYGVGDLGFYNRADNARQIPMQALWIFLSRVAFPIFSAAAGDIERIRRGMQYSIRGVMFINIPIMLGLMVTSESVIVLIYGDQWISATPLLQILCLGGILMPLHLINLNAIKAIGHSKVFFKAELIKKLIGTGMLVFGLMFGILGLAWSQVAYSIMGFLVNAYFSGRYFNYGPLQQVLDFLPALLLSAIMACTVFAMGEYWHNEFIPLLSLQVVVGGVFFIMLCQVFRLKAYTEVRTMLTQGFAKNKSI